MEFVTRDGVNLALERAGEGTLPLVFVHGWSCDRSFFAPQMEHFASRHPIAALDLRGHGDSDRPPPDPGVYTVDEFAGDVTAVVAACGWERPVVIGHSMGGVVAAALAGRGEVSGAVMVDPAPLSPAHPIREFFTDAIAACRADDDGSWRTAFVEGMFLSTDTARREEIIEGMAGRPTDIAAACIGAMRDFDGLAALAASTMPVASIGSAAPANPPERLREAKADIVIGQTLGAGHFNQLEVPDQVNAMIERFLFLIS